MALGNTYGFLMVVLLLGYSLVDLPKQIWRQANPETELRRTQIVASNADEALFEAVWELQDCEDLIDKVATRIGNSEESRVTIDSYYARCVDKLLTARKSTATLSPEMQRRRTVGRGRHDEASNTELGDSIPSIANLALCYMARLRVILCGLVLPLHAPHPMMATRSCNTITWLTGG